MIVGKTESWKVSKKGRRLLIQNKIKITAMAEFIVNIAPEKEALIKELVEQLGGSVDNVAPKKVKSKPDLAPKELLVREIKDAVEELKLVRAGKKKLRNAEDFLNEL